MIAKVDTETVKADYTQWARKPKRTSFSAIGREFKKDESKLLKQIQGIGNSNAAYSQSSICKHAKDKDKAVAFKAFDSERTEDNIAVLRVQVKAVKESIKKCQQHYIFLIRENIRLKEELDSGEKETNSTVSDLLEKYHKFRGNMALMKRRHADRLKETQMYFEQTKTSTENDIERIANACQDVTKQLDMRKSEMRKLLTFKEKEYPENMIKMGKLRREIKQFDDVRKTELNEMLVVMKIEKQNYHGVAGQLKVAAQKSLAEKAVATLPSTEFDIAVQNALMRKELAIQQNEVSVLEYEINDLLVKIRQLKEERRESRRVPLTPFLQKKCLPDTELVLDIPRERVLPF